jgi:hypothetical protein
MIYLSPITRLAVCLQLITFQRKRANRRIVNEDALMALLRLYAPVQVVEFNSTHSFIDQISTLSRTGVFISVRSPTTALPQRSAAGWVWHKLLPMWHCTQTVCWAGGCCGARGMLMKNEPK